MGVGGLGERWVNGGGEMFNGPNAVALCCVAQIINSSGQSAQCNATKSENSGR